MISIFLWNYRSTKITAWIAFEITVSTKKTSGINGFVPLRWIQELFDAVWFSNNWSSFAVKLNSNNSLSLSIIFSIMSIFYISGSFIFCSPPGKFHNFRNSELKTYSKRSTSCILLCLLLHSDQIWFKSWAQVPFLALLGQVFLTSSWNTMFLVKFHENSHSKRSTSNQIWFKSSAQMPFWALLCQIIANPTRRLDFEINLKNFKKIVVKWRLPCRIWTWQIDQIIANLLTGFALIWSACLVQIRQGSLHLTTIFWKLFKLSTNTQILVVIFHLPALLSPETWQKSVFCIAFCEDGQPWYFNHWKYDADNSGSFPPLFRPSIDPWVGSVHRSKGT